MKAAVISYSARSEHFNYGAILHGYAFKRVLSQLGCEAEVIDYVPQHLEGYHWRWPIFNAFRMWRSPVSAIRYALRWLCSLGANLRTANRIHRFLADELGVKDGPLTGRQLAADALADHGYDVFVCASDVIWRKRSGYPLDKGFFLDFPAAAASRRIAYAPSLRPYDDPDVERELVRLAAPFAAVSARERIGAAYLSRLLGREIPHLLDPTLLLAGDDYAPLAKPPARKDAYVLLYMCMKHNGRMVRAAADWARRLGKRLVEVGHYGIDRLLYRHEVVDDAGVEEWLGLFRAADAVVCNSFHGICFAVLFKKPFYVFGRESDDPRFADLCETLGLGERLLPPDGTIPAETHPIDFAAVEARLAPLRARSLAFIRDFIVNQNIPAEGK